MKKKNRNILLLVGGIVVIIILAVALGGGGPEATPVNVKEVMVIDITEEVSASGTVQPKTQVNITSEVTAEVIRVPVREGQEVKKGQILVQLDTVQLQKDYDQVKYSLDEIRSRAEASKAMYLQSKEDYERQQELFDRELVSETVLDNARYQYENNKYSYEAMLSQIKQAQARFEKAEDNLNKTRILAPMSGVITYLDAEVGEIAAAQTPYSQGRTLMIISNLDAFEVNVEVDETEINKVDLGQKVKIEVDAFPDTVFSGEVVDVGNTAITSGAGTEQTTNFQVKVLFIDTNVKIKPGMSATVDIITNKREDVLAVPYGAVVIRSLNADSLAKAEGKDIDEEKPIEERPSEETPAQEEPAEFASANDNNPDHVENDERRRGRGRRGNGEDKNIKEYKGVFLLKDGKAHFVKVEAGIADERNIEIKSGIGKDDTVITGPFRTLRDLKHGDPVEKTERQEYGRF